MYHLKVSRLNDYATIPTKKHPLDAGWDLYSAEDLIIPAGRQRVVGTGIKLEGVEGYKQGEVFQIWPKSGLDAKFGIHTGAGVVDYGYRGEILVLLKNMSDKNFVVRSGDQIAQLIPVMIDSELRISETHESLEETLRGQTGGITEYKETVNE